MNRFRSRKKSFNDGGPDTLRRPSTDSEVPALPKFSSKSFGRKKKVQPEPKPEVDIATALPSSDEFRTSLLMPNLSARFSMLREQDDPKSKLGKANDDSVLAPKRISRLGLLGNGAVTENEDGGSINSSIRPPFASTRTDSYGSEGYGTDDDRTMMSRARPGEGNNMFGGRQKIYKIPVDASGSTKSVGKEREEQGRRMGGKALYGDDVAQSAFQKLREQERRDREMVMDERHSDERSNSPPLANYNRNRETSSSTNSGPSVTRTSTAATSVASQKSVYAGHGNMNSYPHPATPGPASERPLPKSRRLYGQGLDQHMHEQQSSAMNRLESLHRQRTTGGTPLPRNPPQSRSATNLNERYQRSAPLYASHDFRAGSPPPSATPPRMGDFDLGLQENQSANHVDSGYGRSPPLSPPLSPVMDSTLASALEPNDIGKATALGAFNKPNMQYNEQQYLERQRQLQQGRESPSLARPFSPSAMSINEQVAGRTRNSSSTSPKSKTGTSKQQQDSQSDFTPASLSEDKDASAEGSADQSRPAMESSFLSNMSDNDLASPLESESEQDLFPPSASYQGPAKPATKLQGILKKPSMDRMPNDDRLKQLPEESLSDGRSDITVTKYPESKNEGSMTAYSDTDSPTLGPTAAMTSINGLNGLIRSHLRNDSGQSSIYPEPSPALGSRFPQESAVAEPKHSHTSAAFFRESTWEPEQPGNAPSQNAEKSGPDFPPPLSLRARQYMRNESPKAQQILGQHTKAQRVLGGEAPRPSLDGAPSWQEQLRAHHARGGSTETEKEREGLANELAERRRLVHENVLTRFEESESRSSSPAPGFRGPDKRIPFGIMKSKTSKESLAKQQDQSTKAMKMLGMGANSDMQVKIPRPTQDGFSTRGGMPSQSRDSRPSHDNRQGSTRFRTKQRPHNHEVTQRLGKGDSSSMSSRERSSSEVSEKRLEPRGGRQHDKTLHEAADEGANDSGSVARARHFPSDTAALGQGSSVAGMAGPPKLDQPQSATNGRPRNNSRTHVPGYFERPAHAPMQSNDAHMAGNGPTTPNYSVHSAPTPHETPSMYSNDSVPIMIPPSSSHGTYSSPSHGHRRSNRKYSIRKHDISEPIFRSCTSSFDVVDLPPGASLKNGMEPRTGNDRPPVPPINPRRKRTQTILQALGRSEKASEPVPAPSLVRQDGDQDPYEEKSTFSADENEGPKHQRSRTKLRKTASEASSMNARARREAAAAEREREMPMLVQQPPISSTTMKMRGGDYDAQPVSSPTRANFQSQTMRSPHHQQQQQQQQLEVWGREEKGAGGGAMF
ncbi:MAG: hypothetical protein Q9190_000506 [Brigantiaea leucoxantha]